MSQLAAAITVPALAMASVCRNFMQFIVTATGLAAALAIFFRDKESMAWLALPETDAVRRMVAIAVLVTAAVFVVAVQYRSRLAGRSRALGVAGAVVAISIYLWLPPASAWSLRTALAEPQHLEITLHAPPEREARKFAAAPPGRVWVLLPVNVMGVPERERARAESVEVELTGADGTRVRNTARSPYRAFAPIPLAAYLITDDDSATFNHLMLDFDAQTYRRLNAGSYSVRGKASIVLYRSGGSGQLKVGASNELAGLGRCFSTRTRMSYSGEMLKVECESPAPTPAAARATLQASGQTWRGQGGRPVLPYLTISWLSPLNRWQTFFPITQVAGNHFQVPAQLLPVANITICTERVAGYATLRFEFRDVMLNSYR